MNTITIKQQNMLLGLDFLVDDDIQSQETECALTESELIYRAVRNTVNQIWKKYSSSGEQIRTLNSTEIKGFLRDFLADMRYSEADLDLVLHQINLDQEGINQSSSSDQ